MGHVPKKKSAARLSAVEPARGSTSYGADAASPEREAILSASAVLFDEVGYHHATIANIADRAEVSKAVVYEHFGTKHDILFDIHNMWIDELLAMSYEWMDERDDVIGAVQQIFSDLFYVIHSEPSRVRTYFEYWRELPPDLQQKARMKRDAYEKRVEDIIRRGIDSGVFRAQGARVATFGLFGMCNWAHHWYRPTGSMSHQEIADQLCDIYLRGMCSTGRRGRRE